MPSRRTFLAVLATTAGCTTRTPGTQTSTTTPGTNDTTTNDTTTSETTTSATPEPPAGMSWAFAPEGTAGQVAAGASLVFVADDAGNLYGVDPATGDERWSRSFENPVGTRRAFDGTLLAVQDALYALTGSQRGAHGQHYAVHRLDPASGAVRWTASPDISYHFLSVLDATPEAVLVGTQNDVLGGWDDPTIALDATTGGRRWQVSTGDADSGVLGGTHAFVGSYAGVTAIDRDQGARNWRRKISDPTPVYRGPNAVFVGSKEFEHSKAMALDPASGDPRWTFDDWTITSLNHAAGFPGPFVGGAKVARLDGEGNPVWTNDAGGLIAETPVASDVLYGLTDGEAFGLATDSGERIFSYTPGWQYPRPVTVADGVVIVEAGRSARLGGVATDGTELWTAAFDSDGVTAVAAGGGTVAATADGVLYGRPLQG